MVAFGRLVAQQDSGVYATFTAKQYRADFYQNLITNSITKNLSLPLNIHTANRWQSAFSAIELIDYQQPWINAKLKIAADSLQNTEPEFQQAFIEMLYAGNHKAFYRQVNQLFHATSNAKILAMSAEYLLLADTTTINNRHILQACEKRILEFQYPPDMATIDALITHVNELHTPQVLTIKQLQSLLNKNFLKGQVVVYSLQRKNRNYPGIVIIKDTAGNFVKDGAGKLVGIAQLARSLSNMPSYISNGNTPQGIFRMHGFGKSKNTFIGPTENLQLTMPFETSMVHFLQDSSITDSAWSRQRYAQLLPTALKNHQPIFGSFDAGAAGRTEIIAHGTTVMPEWYKGNPYYPFTPTAGCLCTVEIWDFNGRRVISDQFQLANAVKKAGGAAGYFVVIEVDDQQKAVSLAELIKNYGVELSISN